MKKKKTISVILAVIVFLFCSLLSGCGSGEPLERVAKLLDGATGEITVTDIRNEVPVVAQEYSMDEMEEILIILNDSYNGQLAEADYYEDICEYLNTSDINTLYSAISGADVPQKGDDDKKPEKESEREPEDETNSEIRPRPRVNYTLIIIIAAAVVAVVIVVVVLVVVLKSKKSKPAKRRPVYDDDDDDDDYNTGYGKSSSDNSGSNVNFNANARNSYDDDDDDYDDE